MLERIFKHLESMNLLTPDSVVIDFMSGTGRTNTMAALWRYRTISVELEPHFIEMIAGYDCDGKSISDFKIEPCVCKSDTLHKPHKIKTGLFEVECSGNPRIVPVCRCGGKHLHKKHHVIGNKELLEQVTGRKVRWDVIQGDARELTKLLHESDFVGVVSPPYFSQVAYQDKEFIKSIAEDKSQRYRDGRLKGHFATPEAIRRYAEKIMETYSLDPRNIGNLPDKPLVAIVSPPYAEAQQGGGIAIEGYNGPHIHEMGKNQPGKVGRACGYMKEFHGSDYAQIGNMKDIPLVAVVSPPYQDTAMSMGCPSHIRKLAREGDWDKAIELERKSEAEQAKKGNKYAVSTDETIRKKIEMALERERGNYSENPDNIGNLPDNKGNQPGESYLSAMFKVYQQAFLCGISPLVVVTKNPTRNGALRRLDLDTISLLQASGYEIFDYHRAILFETHTQNTLDGESRDVHKGRISFFKRLSLEKGTAVAQWEDIIFARIPIKCARSISELRAPDSGREFVTCPR
ncbi:hypothetical protein KKH23_05715 [Patescibacteria group bacterium]|nr:hypothetical protein [Patescibacteria group bacterium]